MVMGGNNIYNDPDDCGCEDLNNHSFWCNAFYYTKIAILAPFWVPVLGLLWFGAVRDAAEVKKKQEKK